MKKTIAIAAALLVLQIGLAVALYFGQAESDLQTPNSPLLGMTSDAVTTVEITGPEKERIVLQKSGNNWILPDSFAAPANSSQVSALLAKLAGLKQGLAVATTAGAAKRFKVADDSFQRHVVLRAGESVVGDLYVGTSPGFRQIHARKAGTENVVVVELSTFELETGADQWLDKDMFRVKEEDIEKISFADFTLQKNDKDWQLLDLPEGQTTDAKAAGELVAKVTGLTVQTVLQPQGVEPLFSSTLALHFSITRKDGGTAEFRLAKAEGDYYVLKQSERDLYCKVHSLQVEGLVKAGRDALIAKLQPAEPEKAAEEGAEKAAEKNK
ncbi:MAG: DUF4340 domain-containing protein [Proteobacteria bacterium]|nr:DUF4340 domain-containing protein [Pseudomonadota bacterium]